MRNTSFRTNRTPFADVCSLISVTDAADVEGYKTSTETVSEVFCSICNGVVRSEWYEAYKAGIRLSLTVEVNEGDYAGQTLLDYDSKRYKIERTYPTGYGTLELSCSEEIR